MDLLKKTSLAYFLAGGANTDALSQLLIVIATLVLEILFVALVQPLKSNLVAVLEIVSNSCDILTVAAPVVYILCAKKTYFPILGAGAKNYYWCLFAEGGSLWTKRAY